MATLKHPSGLSLFHLRPQTMIGRSRTSDLILQNTSSSGQHALLRWLGNGWELRDLGSRNGTHIDGQKLELGERVLLKRGTRLSFGDPSITWLFESDGPPLATAFSGEVEICSEGGMISLPPGSEEPVATIFTDRGGRWVIEREGSVTPAPKAVTIDGQAWTLFLPEITESTFQSHPLGLQGSLLRFFVSADEETTHLTLVSGKEERRLAERAHHYLLLTLARIRLEHREEGYSPEEEGWIDRESLADALRIDSAHVNVQIHRARRQLASKNIVDAANIVERRAQAGQIRLGVGEIEIVRL